MAASDVEYGVIYDLWLGTWRTTLAAVASGIQGGTLSTTEAAAHRAAIVAEREVVTRHFALLLSQVEITGSQHH